MGSSGAIRAGRAFVELFADDSKLVRGLRSNETRLKGWGSKVRNIGNAIFAAGGALQGGLMAITQFAEHLGAAISLMSAKTGASVEALSTLGYAAEQRGVDMDSLANGLTKMQKNMAAAAGGSKKAAASFDSLGLSAGELMKMSPDEQFAAIAEKIAQIQNPAERTAAAMGIFGKAGAGLLPLLNEGSGGIAALREEADRLGITISGEDAEALHKYGNAQKSLWATVKATAVVIGATLAPVLQKTVQMVQQAIVTAQKWIKENRGLFLTIKLVATALLVLGGLIIGVGTALTIAGTVLGGFATAISAVGSIIGFILSPIGLVIAGIVALGVYLWKTTDYFSRGFTYLKNLFADLAADAGEAFGVIREALASGDIATAAKVLWALLKLEWQRGVSEINKLWLPAKKFFLDVWTEATGKISEVFIKAFYGIQTAWTEVCAFMRDSFTVVGGASKGILARLQGSIAALILAAQGHGEDSEEKKTLVEDFQRRMKGIDQEQNDALNKSGEQRKKALDDIHTQQKGAIEENQKMTDEGYAKNARQEKDAVSEKEQALAAARKEFETAVAAGKEANKNRPKGRGLGTPPPKFDADKLASSKTSVSGTFSGLRLEALGAGGATEQTAKNTAKLVELAKRAEQRDEDQGDDFIVD